MDMAIVDGSWAYHSPEDDLAHLDASTLQHYGDLTLSLSREVGERDLGALEAEGGATPVLTTTAAGILRLPPAVVAVVGLLAPLARSEERRVGVGGRGEGEAQRARR